MVTHQLLEKETQNRIKRNVEINPEHRILKVEHEGKKGLVAYGYQMDKENVNVKEILTIPCVFDDIFVVDYKEEDYYHFYVRYLKVKLDGKYGIIKIGYQTLFSKYYQMKSFMDVILDTSVSDELKIDEIIQKEITNSSSLKMVKKMKFLDKLILFF